MNIKKMTKGTKKGEAASAASQEGLKARWDSVC